jgi:FMN phosphatase YigB (HAD superfamily)
MIDDSSENIQSAQRLGMGTILFQSTDSFFAELKRRNIPEEQRNEINFGFSVR